MTAGIEVINDAGTVLIDENYANLCVVASGTATANATGTWSASAPAGLVSPVLAVRATGGRAYGTRIKDTFGGNADPGTVI